MKKYILIVQIVISLFLLNLLSTQVNAAWNKNRLIDDPIFDKSETLSKNDIQNFLNTFPDGCLKTYKAPYPNGYNSYGAKVSAATVIRRVADIYEVNPQVILSTLQKESSVVSSDCTYINTAMGYNCPDSGGCDPDDKGFSKQVTRGTWLLKFGKERSNGNVSWEANDGVGGDRYLDYSGPMTEGCKKRQMDAPTVCYDGYTTIDGQAVHIDTGATGSLYNYTPHLHGNQNFFNIFSDWFGNPLIDPNKDRVIVGDWDGDGRETPAIKRGNSYFFDNNDDGDVVDNIDNHYSWGKPTDQVLVGNWNGTNDGIGLKRGNQYFLDYDNNGSSNKSYSWGKPTDQVLVGNWYGSSGNTDKLGLKRGNQYFFDWDNNGASNASYSWGKDSDQAIIGSWYGSAGTQDKLGLKRGNQYFFDWDNNGASNASYSWGKDSDQVLVGNWYGSPNGRDSIGLKRGNQYFFDWDNNGASDVSYAWGNETDKLLVGHWFGAADGKDSIGLKRGSRFFLDFDNDANSEASFVYSY